MIATVPAASQMAKPNTSNTAKASETQAETRATRTRSSEASSVPRAETARARNNVRTSPPASRSAELQPTRRPPCGGGRNCDAAT